MDRLGHFDLYAITSYSAFVPRPALCAIERMDDNTFAISLYMPGRDNLIFIMQSAAPIKMSHHTEMTTDEEAKATRFEILPRDQGDYYVVDHWRDEPYPVFSDRGSAEQFVQAAGGK